ncbi:FHA domain-containing protein [Methyloraptor flagellatus]|uniref:FHA domain-containing protein n=1 Tax=Methyloraptor flagellatus TaxID=3162530 RepID=A0AAU7XIV5_9HYPH
MPDDKVETPSDKRRPEDPDVEITRLVKRPAAGEIAPPVRSRPVMEPPVRRAPAAEPERPAPREPAGGLAPEDLEPTRAMPRRAEPAAPGARAQDDRASGPAASSATAGPAPVAAPPPRLSPFDRRIPHLEIATPDNEETRFVPRSFGEATGTGSAPEADTADEGPTAVMPRRRVPAPPFPPRGVSSIAEPDEAADLRPTRAVGPGGVATRLVLPADPPVAVEAEAEPASALASEEPVSAEPASVVSAAVESTASESVDLESTPDDQAPIAPALPEAVQAAPAAAAPPRVEPEIAASASATTESGDVSGPAPVTPEPVPEPEAVVLDPEAPASAPAPAPPSVPNEVEPEPVVAWLVVTKGPGRGAFRALGPGRNNLGSSEAATVRLDFGDPAIAPSGHAYIVYDDETRGFVIEDGKRRELVRVNGRLLSDARDLADRDEIRIGATTLVFVAFCGPGFDWGAAG